MALNLPYGIRVANNDPLDFDRYIAIDIAARDSLVTNNRAYEGLQVYVESEQTLYILLDVFSNTWSAIPDASALIPYIDGSLNDIRATYVPNSSIGLPSTHTIYWNNGYLESSTGVAGAQGIQGTPGLMGAQGIQGAQGVQGTTGFLNEASVNEIYAYNASTYISDASLGTDFYWQGGLLEVSVGAGPSGVSIDGGVWITDISPTSGGNVGDKVTSSDGVVLDSCLTDTSSLTVHVLALPGHTNYKPMVTINGNPVSISASADKPVFTGTYPMTYNFADASITVVHEDGAYWSTTVDADTPAVITSADFINGYPGSQTELKAGDTFDVSVMTDVSISSVIVDNFGAATGGTYTVNGNNVGFTITIADRGDVSTYYGLRLRVVKSTGSTSANYLTTDQGSVDGKDVVLLNDLYPSISIPSVLYPTGQSAIKSAEDASVNNTVANYDTISYVSSNGQLTIANASTYETVKKVTYLSGGYNITTNNFSITANRAANNATTGPTSTVVWIASTAPTLSVSHGTAFRSGGNDGTSAQDHVITINSNQRLQAAPTLTKDTAGTWLGTGFSWSTAATSFTRSLQVNDNMTKGTYNWGAILGTGLAGLTQTTNSGTTQYELRGFVERTISIPAFGWQAQINVQVTNYSNLSSTGSGQNLNWDGAVGGLTIRGTLGDTTRPKASTWTASGTGANPTTINILDKSATDAKSETSYFDIQESI